MARLTVRVTPRAGRNAVDGLGDNGELRVRVAAAPADGAANEAVRRLLARVLGIRPSDVTIATGGTSRTKIIDIDGLDEREVRRRLTELG